MNILWLFHRLGIDHYGSTRGCNEQYHPQNIMNLVVKSNYDNFQWSKCSRKTILSKVQLVNFEIYY